MYATKVVSALALAGVLLFGAQGVSAQDSRLNSLVRYDDLNLSDKEHAKALYVRVLRAAKKVCTASASTDLNGRTHFKACTDRAVSGAVADINHPNLSHHHFVRTGEQVPPVSMAGR